MLMGIGCENGYPLNTNPGANRPPSFKPLSSRPGSASPAGANTHSALMSTHAGEERMFSKHVSLTRAVLLQTCKNYYKKSTDYYFR